MSHSVCINIYFIPWDHSTSASVSLSVKCKLLILLKITKINDNFVFISFKLVIIWITKFQFSLESGVNLNCEKVYEI